MSSRDWAWLAAAGTGAAALVAAAVYRSELAGLARSAAGAEHAPEGESRSALRRLAVAELNAQAVVGEIAALGLAAARIGSADAASSLLVACGSARERCHVVLGQLSTVAGPAVLPGVRARRKAAVRAILGSLGDSDDGGSVDGPGAFSERPTTAGWSGALLAAARLLDAGQGEVGPAPALAAARPPLDAVEAQARAAAAAAPGEARPGGVSGESADDASATEETAAAEGASA